MEQARYNTYGELNAAKDNLLIVCHALTGNSRLDQWWGTMLGEFIHQNLPSMFFTLVAKAERHEPAATYLPCIRPNSVLYYLELGPGRPFDTSKYMVVCANVLGSCYGSTGPQSIDPKTGLQYGNTFPQVSTIIFLSLSLGMICV